MLEEGLWYVAAIQVHLYSNEVTKDCISIYAQRHASRRTVSVI